MRSPGIKKIRWIYKPVIHVLALAPLAWLIFRYAGQALGVNPVETLTHETGQWGLRILLLTLAVSPLAQVSRSGWLIHFRRLIGLYCFFYVGLHFVIYLVFDLALSFTFLYEDILDRPYITVGFLGFVILFGLAVTSPMAIRRRMGHAWNRLHKGVYVAGVCGVVHFLWITRVDDTEPMIYGVVFVLLMGFRLRRKRKKTGRGYFDLVSKSAVAKSVRHRSF